MVYYLVWSFFAMMVCLLLISVWIPKPKPAWRVYSPCSPSIHHRPGLTLWWATGTRWAWPSPLNIKCLVAHLTPMSRFDLMMSYGDPMGLILSFASLFCMFLYFVTTVDSGRWALCWELCNVQVFNIPLLPWISYKWPKTSRFKIVENMSSKTFTHSQSLDNN